MLPLAVLRATHTAGIRGPARMMAERLLLPADAQRAIDHSPLATNLHGLRADGQRARWMAKAEPTARAGREPAADQRLRDRRGHASATAPVPVHRFAALASAAVAGRPAAQENAD
jgi:hypothetical protein